MGSQQRWKGKVKWKLRDQVHAAQLLLAITSNSMTVQHFSLLTIKYKWPKDHECKNLGV